MTIANTLSEAQGRLSIVLPAKNEAQAIGPVVARLREQFADAQIIVVNDGSTDATADAASYCWAFTLRWVKPI